MGEEAVEAAGSEKEQQQGLGKKRSSGKGVEKRDSKRRLESGEGWQQGHSRGGRLSGGAVKGDTADGGADAALVDALLDGCGVVDGDAVAHRHAVLTATAAGGGEGCRGRRGRCHASFWGLRALGI